MTQVTRYGHRYKPRRGEHRWNLLRSASGLAAEYGAEVLPSVALEPSKLHLLDRREIKRAGVHRDTGQQIGGSEVFDVRGLLHDVLASQVVAALLQHVGQSLCLVIPPIT